MDLNVEVTDEAKARLRSVLNCLTMDESCETVTLSSRGVVPFRHRYIYTLAVRNRPKHP